MRSFNEIIHGLRSNTEVPDTIRNSFESSLENLPDKKKGVAFIKIAMPIAACFAICAIFCFNNPVIAEKMSNIGNIFNLVENQSQFKGDFSEKSEVLVTEDSAEKEEIQPLYSVEDAGIKVSFSEIYSDGLSVYLTAEFYVEKGGLSNIPGDNFQTMYLKGTWSLGGDNEEKIFDNDNFKGTVIDDNTFIGMLKLDISERNVSESKIRLNIDSLGYDDINDKEGVGITYENTGHWNAELPFNVDTESIIIIDTEISENGYSLDKIEITPIQLITYMEYPENEFFQTVIFNQDGEQINYVEFIEHGVDAYSINNKEISKLYIYSFDDFDTWIDVVKGSGMDNENMEKAVFSAEVEVK